MATKQHTPIRTEQLETVSGGLGVGGTIALTLGGVAIGAAAVGIPNVREMWKYVTTR